MYAKNVTLFDSFCFAVLKRTTLSVIIHVLMEL